MFSKSKVAALGIIGLFVLSGIGACSKTSANEQNGISNISVASAKEEISAKSDLTIIDVRTADEYAAGHLEKAVNIDFLGSDFEEKLAILPKDKEYLVYCRSGNRSTQSMNIFKKLGFTNVKNVQGGYNQLK